MRSKGPAALCLAALLSFCAVLYQAAPALGEAGDPLFVFAPHPPPCPQFPYPYPPLCPPYPRPDPPQPPPNWYFNGPCGVTVDASGDFWVSDHYHRSIDVFEPDAEKLAVLQGFVGQPLSATSLPDPHTRLYDDPCGLALDSTGTLYVNDYHREVARFPSPVSAGTGTALPGSEEATGVAVDPATDDAYVDVRDHVVEYDPGGAFAQNIGGATLEDGYGAAISGYAPTAGYLYVPDAASDTVKVYDPATDTDNPIEEITGPSGGFTSLVDSSVAVDNRSGAIYVLDNTQPADTEEPRGRVDVFDATGAYLGHLRYDVIDAAPSGIAVDNADGPNQGRVYVTSGNTDSGAVYAYNPGSATTSTPLDSKFHPPLPGSGLLFPTVSIGGPGGAALECEDDACQILPPEPTDPTLTTLLSGYGNPRPHWRQYRHRAKGKKAKGGKK